MFKRTLEKKVTEIIKHYPVVLITGARQVGKSTLFEMIRNNNPSLNLNYVTLDDPLIRMLAQEDPRLFIQRYTPPIVIDEIQYAPELFSFIKIIVDKEKKAGQYLLTGSQMFTVMQGVRETLAGRVGVLNLFSLSRNEINGFTESPFLPTLEFLSQKQPKQETINTIFEQLFRGGMPKLVSTPEMESELYFSSYFQTYIEKDIRNLLQIKNENKFISFVSQVASLTGNELIYNNLAKNTGVDLKTAQEWISLLESSGIIYLLRPYENSNIKRIIKRPKIIFMDTGLCAYLSRWMDAKTLEISAMSGAIFETYVISEIIKSYTNNGIDVRNRLFYYRDSSGNEIDLLIIQNGTVYPIEIKKSGAPSKDAIKNFHILNRFNLEIGEGAVISMVDTLVPIDEKNMFVPLAYI